MQVSRGICLTGWLVLIGRCVMPRLCGMALALLGTWGHLLSVWLAIAHPPCQVAHLARLGGFPSASCGPLTGSADAVYVVSPLA
eukprot:1447586-Amphidinium_carterae.2